MRHLRLLLVAYLALAAPTCEEGTGGPDLPADTVAPTVTALSPVPFERDVGRDATITITFSEPINPATVGVASFLVRRGVDTLAGTYVSGDSSAGFDPSDLLEPDTEHFVNVTRGIRDPAGNQLVRDTAWSFWTGSGITPPTRR